MGPPSGWHSRRPDHGDRRESRDRHDKYASAGALSKASDKHAGPWGGRRSRSRSPRSRNRSPSPPRNLRRDQAPSQNTTASMAAPRQTDVTAATTSTTACPGPCQRFDDEARSALGELRRYLDFHSRLSKHKEDLKHAQAEMQHEVNQAYPEIGESAKGRFQVAEKHIDEAQSNISETESRLLNGFRHLFIDTARQPSSAESDFAEVDKRVQAMSQDLKTTMQRQMAEGFKKMRAEVHAHYENKIINLEKRLDESESKNARLERDMQNRLDAKDKEEEVAKSNSTATQLTTDFTNLKTSVINQLKCTVATVDNMDQASKAIDARVSDLENAVKSDNITADMEMLAGKQGEFAKQLSELTAEVSRVTRDFPVVANKVDHLNEVDQRHESRITQSNKDNTAISKRVQKLESTSQRLTKNFSEIAETAKQFKEVVQPQEACALKDYKAILDRVQKLESASELGNNISPEVTKSLKQLEEAGQRHEANITVINKAISERVQRLENAFQHVTTHLSDVSESVTELQGADHHREEDVGRLYEASQRHEESVKHLDETDGRHEMRFLNLDKDNAVILKRVQKLENASHATPAMPVSARFESQAMPEAEADVSSIRVQATQAEEKIQLIATATLQERLSPVAKHFGDFLDKERKARVQAEERLDHSVRSQQLLESKVQGHADVISAFSNSVRVCIDSQNMLKDQARKDLDDMKLQMDSFAQFQNSFSTRGWYDGIYSHILQTLPNGISHQLASLDSQIRTFDTRLSNIEQEFVGAKRRKLPAGHV